MADIQDGRQYVKVVDLPKLSWVRFLLQKFGLIDNFDMLSAILDVSHYPKSQNWLPFL